MKAEQKKEEIKRAPHREEEASKAVVNERPKAPEKEVFRERSDPAEEQRSMRRVFNHSVGILVLGLLGGVILWSRKLFLIALLVTLVIQGAAVLLFKKDIGTFSERYRQTLQKTFAVVLPWLALPIPLLVGTEQAFSASLSENALIQILIPLGVYVVLSLLLSRLLIGGMDRGRKEKS